ncbi:TPA: helix-turn-helix transcriptional regulator [Burkholderia cepacia ATCC 25416]|uniref:winged helix-turn-helix transcriptional regulator n=1 Tax=Burkholderia cepacia TaxID=292 RepID=UPI00075E36E9|nr:helix-turn-helix domain-containing protein [Burkholderia cepacia]HDR9767040.1 helix-turn-helix transcriptional regulator [Burkholderia cepacia ATCC 25416]KWH34238.1 HxlR family transcriptional regulator [Burkholderia cepacia]MCA8080892.1 helix-turn-helix transcriptional regulator [Burkholderia cepacia]HDR9774145.1 helix-turn-helix transcriptional regulator [Burkholderia cepacia ATCC 25416]HDR9783103.1 helix-turn-helix transcriptional regulator [Burkholderia cepacia ATCC 25416]
MKWDDIGTLNCSVARTLAVLGDRWTMLILRNAFLGCRRFDAFQTQLGITRHVLAERLARLVDEGVLAKRAYQERPPRFEYRLTDKGLDLYPTLLALTAWGDRWKDDGQGPPVQLRHRTCGHLMHAVTVCSACGEPLDARDVQPERGPGWVAAEAAGTASAED